ncbi:hypothetical protein WME89_28900 [Sorangium sp. So ce321]|uniref:hypothetical protein n=1 Tax=Sorangium sp. So ce321 TaxID=3133300 RepID=UPI003F624ACC
MMTSRISGSVVLCLGLAPLASGCVDGGEGASPLDPPAAVEPQAVYGNSLSPQALTRNALITNRAANSIMVNEPLATETYSDTSSIEALHHQLHHGPTREVMEYLVSCALDPTQTVSYDDTLTGESYTFTGELGLCPGWASGPASVECQEQVSACLLLRVNALKKKVAISMRGEVPGAPPGMGPTALLYPEPAVSTVDYEEDIEQIASFAPCATATSGAARNCGWKADHVGRCLPGERVYIGAGARPPSKCGNLLFPVLGSSTGNTVLRVCEGIHGCNATTSTFIAQSGASCGSNRPALEFTCPEGGYFSVMSGPQSSGGAGVASPAIRDQATAVYPAPELAVFLWPEGAFYGNLWGPGALNPAIPASANRVKADGSFIAAPPVAGSVFLRAFACTGRFWTRQEAYMTDRICAGGGADCAATWVGACDVSNSNTPSCPPVHRCTVTDGPVVSGDGDFGNCDGNARKWQYPISVYLNNPLDIVDDPASAETTGAPWAPLAPLCF